MESSQREDYFPERIKQICLLEMSNFKSDELKRGCEEFLQQNASTIQESYSNILRDKGDQSQKNLIFSAYSFIMFISLIGNMFVVGAIFSSKRARTSTSGAVNVFIGNLAVSDLIMTVFTIPFHVVRTTSQQWEYGQLLCHVGPFIQVTSVYVSTLTMTFIACDRFQAILRPMKPRITSRTACAVAILVIWIISLLFAFPHAYTQRVVTDNVTVPLVRCRVVASPSLRKHLSLSTFALQFLLPFSIMMYCYICIGVKIWSRATIGATTREQENMQSVAKKRTIFMLLLVGAVFAICWLPLNLYHIYILLTETNHDISLYSVAHWLAMSSVMYNPFIYFWLNRRFQFLLKSMINTICSGLCHCRCLYRMRRSESPTLDMMAVALPDPQTLSGTEEKKAGSSGSDTNRPFPNKDTMMSRLHSGTECKEVVEYGEPKRVRILRKRNMHGPLPRGYRKNWLIPPCQFGGFYQQHQLQPELHGTNSGYNSDRKFYELSSV